MYWRPSRSAKQTLCDTQDWIHFKDQQSGRSDDRKIYHARFDSAQVAAKRKLWQVLVKRFLQGYLPTDDSVADVGGGYCESVNVMWWR